MPQISPSSQAASATTPQPGKLPNLRWIICGLLLFASTINYVDRQTIAVLKPTLQHSLHWSESDYGWIIFSFQFAYAVMMLLAGRIIDAIGTRLGFAITMVWWSLAAMGHALATGAISFGVARFLLGAGEAGNFPASIKTVAEWFPRRERALATGIFNAGTNIGAVLAPPLVVWLTLRWSWHEAFIFTGSLGLLWLIFWLALYDPPLQHKRLSSEELAIIQSDRDLTIGAPAIPWRQLASCRQAWGVIIAKFCTDPVWWFFIFWLPSYLIQGRGMTLKQIGYFAWIPFLAADIGSVLGGWFSGRLLALGWSVNAARKTAMAACAFCMPVGIAAVFAPKAWMAIALISVSTSAHQGWSANVYTLASDLFPRRAVATIIGMAGAGGAIGGMIIAPVAGYTLQWFHTYVPLFIVGGVMHPLALGLVHLIVPDIKPVAIAAEV